MLVKENTIPRNHVAARPPASNANRADLPTNRRRRRILVIGAVIGVLCLFFGIRYWMYASTHEDTDDAYVTGYTHQIRSRITGTVEGVLVDDYWHVTAGQPLLKLDPRDYEVALQKDRASYLQAQAQLLQASAQIPLAEAQLAQAQALMAVVEDNVWIVANLKETQLERVRVGQPVDITIDALPHYRFKGRVDSLQPGTGSNFALLPPDNATGNFIKIVQRVPVKILFDPESIKAARDKIVPGLSAVPSIAVTQPVIDNPYPGTPENEKPSHQPASEPITQIRGVPATGVMQ
jgi:membrane fusion protein, multidrug efflux system